MANISISPGTDEEKKNPGGNVKPNLPGLGGSTNTDGGGAAVPGVGTIAGENSGAGSSGGSAAGSIADSFINAGNNTAGDNIYRPGAGTTTGGSTVPSAQETAETNLAQLRNEYAAQLRAQYNDSAERLKAERDEALRENWILQQQAEAALPEQMAARGTNGGATETSLAALRAQFQGNRNDIRGGFADNLSELNSETAQQQAEAQRAYNERWMEYLLSLAEKEKDYEYAKKLG